MRVIKNENSSLTPKEKAIYNFIINRFSHSVLDKMMLEINKFSDTTDSESVKKTIMLAISDYLDSAL